MMDAKEVVRKALFETYSTKEIKTEPRTVMLQDIDVDYYEFVIKHEFIDYGKVYYFMATLFVVTHETYPEVIPLVSLSNVSYDPEEVIDEFSRVITRMFNESKKTEP